jgi:hypothetical protein
MRSPRRTRADYGVGRTASHYLLTRVHGVGAADAKRISLLLRWQMLRFAIHDLPFVSTLGEAERTLLNIAARQLAYKAARLTETFPDFGLEAVSGVRAELVGLRDVVARVPGAGATPLPPPLILSKAEALLHRSTLVSLLGDAPLLAPASAGKEFLSVADALDGVQVLGIYFSASCVQPAGRTTCA